MPVNIGKKNERSCRGDRTFHFSATDRAKAENQRFIHFPAAVMFCVATYLAGLTGYPLKPIKF